jgi:hypothetical protein
MNRQHGSGSLLRGSNSEHAAGSSGGADSSADSNGHDWQWPNRSASGVLPDVTHEDGHERPACTELVSEWSGPAGRRDPSTPTVATHAHRPAVTGSDQRLLSDFPTYEPGVSILPPGYAPGL